MDMNQHLKWFLIKVAVIRLTCHHLAGGLVQLVGFLSLLRRAPKGTVAYAHEQAHALFYYVKAFSLWRTNGERERGSERGGERERT